MRPTYDQVTSWYNHYNQLLFEGKLPHVPIRSSMSKRSMGKTHCETDTLSGEKFYWIDLSLYYDLPEEDYIDTLVHEMIHLYIMYNGIKDDGPHGTVFTRMMNDINRKHGIKVSTSFRHNEESLSKGVRRWHYFCLSELPDGRLGITVSARTRVFELWEKLPKVFQLRSWQWYVSADPYFDGFRSSTTPKIYLADRDTIARHMKGAERLVKKGNTIRAAEEGE